MTGGGAVLIEMEGTSEPEKETGSGKSDRHSKRCYSELRVDSSGYCQSHASSSPFGWEVENEKSMPMQVHKRQVHSAYSFGFVCS